MLYWDLLIKSPRYLSKRAAREAIRKWAHRLNGTVLDVGSRDSPYTDYLPNMERCVTVDLELTATPSICADAVCLPFRPGQFDSVVCTELLEHVPEPEDVLRECHRVLGPGGVLYITVPMMWYLHYEPNDYYRFTKYGLSYLCEKVGFKVKNVERVGGFTFFILVRFGEAIYHPVERGVSRLLSLVGIRRVFGKRLVSLVLVPYQIVALGLSKLLDRFSPRDAKGWVLLAEVPPHEGE